MFSSNENFGDVVGKLCADYIGGVWSDVNPNDIRIKPLAGLSNAVYLCSIPSAYKVTTTGGEPRHVLLRLYGSHIRADPNRLTKDAVIFALLAERRLGPRLHGIFPGGRLEEYIHCRTLKPHELSTPHISYNVATKLAHLHSVSMPLSKKPSWLFENMREWLDEVNVAYDEQSGHKEISSEDAILLDNIFRMNLSNEIDGLEETVLRKAEHDCSNLLPQVVFCHNDLQSGNILLSTDKGPGNNDLLTFIDYEYSAYNYRAFDIANHFMEWTFDYNRKDAPYYRYEPQKWPSPEQERAFIDYYLQAAAPGIFDSNSSTTQDDQKVVNQYTEWFTSSVQLHSMSSHLLYAIWALAQYFSSSIRFSYLDYASTRLTAYFETQRCLLN